MKRRASGQDVAREAGVSQSTVSLVLNGKNDAGIPEATRQRVLDAAKKLRYSRNATAQALITGRTHRLGVVPEQPGNFYNVGTYYSEVLAGIMEETLQYNYNLLLYSQRYPDWYAMYEDIANGAADGALLIGRGPNDEVTDALLDSTLPVVCISSHPETGLYHAVDCDNEAAGYLAVRHLLEKGHRCVAFAHLELNSSFIRERYQGAKRAWQEAGLPPAHLVTCQVPCGEGDEETLPFAPWMRETLHLFRHTSPRLTAAIYSDEATARSFTELLPFHGLRVPNDLAIVTFNSSEVSARCNPPLTSVWQPARAIGAAATRRLVRLIEGEEVEPGTERFAVRLDARASTEAAR